MSREVIPVVSQHKRPNFDGSQPPTGGYSPSDQSTAATTGQSNSGTGIMGSGGSPLY